MKILAVTAGRKNGNTELMAKTALRVCEEEFGAEVAWVNLHDHVIKPCTGCESCITHMYQNTERPKCIYGDSDDFLKIMDEWEKADGILICVPSYFQAAPGIFKVFTDRFLAYEYGNMVNCGVIDKVPERRVAIMCVGGSAETWQNLTCDQIHAQLTCQSVKVVDKYIFTRAASSGHVLAMKEKMERVKQLGRNLATACQTPYEEVEFMAADYKYFCPVCHSNLIARAYPHWDGTAFKYECVVCETGGDLVMNEQGEVEFQPARNGMVHSRLFSESRLNHLREIQSAHQAADDAQDIIMEERKKFREYHVRKI